MSSVVQWNLSDTAPQQKITIAVLGFFAQRIRCVKKDWLIELVSEGGKIKTEFTYVSFIKDI